MLSKILLVVGAVCLGLHAFGKGLNGVNMYSLGWALVVLSFVV